MLLSLLLLLAVQAMARVWLARNSPVIAKDGTMFIARARELDREGFANIQQWYLHPGYPMVIVLARKAVRGEGLDAWIAAARGVSLNAGLAGVMAVWWFVWLCFGDATIAFWSAMLLGLGRKFAGLGGDGLSDAMTFALMMTAVCMVLLAGRRIAERSWAAMGWAIAAGLLTGAAYWVRPEGLAVGLIAGLFWVALVVWKRRGGWIALASLAAAGLSAGLVMLPYCLAIGGLTKKLAWSQFALGSGTPAVLAELLYPIESPAAVKLISQWFEMIHPVLGGLAVAYLLLWVMGYLRQFRPLAPLLAKPAGEAILLIGIVWVVVVPPLVMRYLQVGAMSHRYLILPAGVMAGFAGAALVCLARLIAVAAHRIRRPAGWTVLLLPVMGLAIAVAMLIHTLRPMNPNDVFYRDASQWARKQLGPDVPILTNRTYLSFYTESPDILRSTLFWEQLQRQARTQPADWMQEELARRLAPEGREPFDAILLERTPGEEDIESALLRCGFVFDSSWRKRTRKDLRQVDLYRRVAYPPQTQPTTSQPR